MIYKKYIKSKTLIEFSLKNHQIRKIQMQDQQIAPSVQVCSIVSKIDQLLRLYQMSKKFDSSKKTQIQKKVNDMLDSIKLQATFKIIQPFVRKKIIAALEEPRVAPKIQKAPSNRSNPQPLSSSAKSNANMSQEKQLVSDASISNNNGMTSSQDISQSKKSQPVVVVGNLSSSSNITPSIPIPSPSQQNVVSSQLSSDKSEDTSHLLLLDNLQTICYQNQKNLQSLLVFNDDIFNILSQTDEPSMVYLFGVNNPEKKSVKKLYICTLMRFTQNQIQNPQDQNGENRFTKEYKMFENSLRSPIGFMMLGKGIEDVKIEHIKFLADMKSPLGVVILLQKWTDRNGVFYSFSSQLLGKSRHLNKVQFPQQTTQLRKNYIQSGKQLSSMQIIKQKLVITKLLPRSITPVIESAQNAIQIESSNECIKEQEANGSKFPYKLHTKYYVSPKSDYQLFFLDGPLVAFKMNFKQKEFDSFKKFVLEEAQKKGVFLMSTSVLKETSQIKKDFWRLLVESGKLRDPYFLINLSGITNKKTVILCLKEGVTEEQVMNAPAFLFKDLQKPTQIINVIGIITKQNYKQFETQSKIQVIDITAKKK